MIWPVLARYLVSFLAGYVVAEGGGIAVVAALSFLVVMLVMRDVRKEAR